MNLLNSLRRRSQVERDMDEELRAHIQIRADYLEREGLARPEAERRARLEFGSIENYKENCREALGVRFFDELYGNVRYALRALRKSPGFTAVAIVTLALGIGANTAIFTLINAVMLKSLPVSHPEQLYLFGAGHWAGIQDEVPNRSWQLFSYPFYRDFRKSNDIFTDILAIQSMANRIRATVGGNGHGVEETFDTRLVSGTYFSTLGVNPAAGRLFSDADDQIPGGHAVAVISYAVWQSRFGGSPTAVGTTLAIDHRLYTIVGVTPPEFFGTAVGEAPQLWIPLSMEAEVPPGWDGLKNNFFQSLYIMGRLKPGVSPEQAGVSANLLFHRLFQEYAAAKPVADREKLKKARLDLFPAPNGLSQLRTQFSLPLRILMGVVGLVLLIGCANIANLLLARASAREREVAVRLAIGATRATLIRQFFTESMVLAFLGAAVGTAFAWWGIALLLRMVSLGEDTLFLSVTPDWRVFGFTLGIALFTGLVFGITPALQATRVDVGPLLKAGKGISGGNLRAAFRRTLVIAQVGICVVLLIGSGLFIRTLVNLKTVDTGFRTKDVMVAGLGVDGIGYKDDDPRLTALYHEIENRVSQLPGVQGASFSMFTFNQGAWTSEVSVPGVELAPSKSREPEHNVVGPRFFDVMGLPFVAGGGFSGHVPVNGQRVGVVNETFARTYFPNQNPVGKVYRLGKEDPARLVQIAGVVRDAKYESLREETPPAAYYPYDQHHAYLWNFVVHFRGNTKTTGAAIQATVRDIFPSLPVGPMSMLSQQVDGSIVKEILIARLCAFFGGLALLLSCIGIYGVLSYAVTRRTNEIGIRMALGARGNAVSWMMLKDTLMLAIIGVALGLPVAFAGGQFARAILFGLRPTDPLTIAASVALMLAVAAAAGYVPARRASRIDPMIALRYE